VLGQIVDAIFEKMKLAGEAGSLLKIENEIRDVVEQAKKQWQEGTKPEQTVIPGYDRKPRQMEAHFDLAGVKDECSINESTFWYARRSNGGLVQAGVSSG
jgi:hypothetical protein